MMNPMMLLFPLFLCFVGLSSSENVRWTIPAVNGKLCDQKTCVVTRTFNYSSHTRSPYLDLSSYIFLGDLYIINPYVKSIRIPQKPFIVPDHKVIIQTGIHRENAIKLRKIFINNQRTILGDQECIVTGNFLPVGCHYVVGDLFIDATFQIPRADQWVERVYGCLFIQNTPFSKEDLDFLNGYVPNNDMCETSKRMLVQRIKNNINLCEYDLFPTLLDFTNERRCGVRLVGIEEGDVKPIVFLVMIFVTLAIHVPLHMIATHLQVKRFVMECLQMDMDRCTNHLMSLVAYEEKTSKNPPSKDKAVRPVKPTTTPEPQPPVIDTERRVAFQDGLQLREKVRVITLWTSAAVVVFIFIMLFVLVH